ncbi:MAG: InlB B-repeat-containing protein [Acholeplasmataceae bacterium]
MRKIKKTILLFLAIVTIFSLGIVNHKKEIIELNAQTENERMLKAVWVSPFVGDVSINGETTFRNTMTNVLNKLDSYGYNALIFHIRIHNNALYPSTINPKSPYVSNINFNNFDPITWLVDETHKRGIEFHAWLNPYRPCEGRIASGSSMPSSNPEYSGNLITSSDSSKGKILDPSKWAVRNHIKLTVKEVIENYDVDAIHFDDYFYVPYSGYSEVEKIGHVNAMIEGVHDVITTHNANNNKHVQFGISPTGIYKNGNGVVSYDPNTGKVTSNGSYGTLGLQHGREDLCSDTLHWMNEGWIDYIMPQIYWERGNSHGDFNKVFTWWNQVASYLPVNFYVGIGLYRATEAWGTDPYELSAQLGIIENSTDGEGYSIYSYRRFNESGAPATQLNNAYEGSNSHRKKPRVLPTIKSMTPIVPGHVGVNHSNGILMWDSSSDAKFYYIFRSTGTLTYSDSEIYKVVGKNITSITTNDPYGTYNYGVKVLSATNHLSGQSIEDPSHTTYSITYNLNGGQFASYNNKEEITEAFLTDLHAFVNPSENLTTFMHGVGKTSGFDGLWYSNEEYRAKIYDANTKSGNNNYFLSHSTYGPKWKPFANFMVNFVAKNPSQSFWDSTYTGCLRMNQYFTNVKPGSAWTDADMAAIPEGLSQSIIYSYDKNTPTFSLPTPEKSGTTFLGWYTNASFSGSPVTQVTQGSTGDKVFYARWDGGTPTTYTVTFNSNGGSSVPSQTIPSGGKVTQPNNPTRSGYTFSGWYDGGSLFDFGTSIYANKTLTAQWQENTPTTYTVNFYSQGTLYTSQTVNSGGLASRPADPTRSGYTFSGWLLGSSVYNFNSPVTQSINLVASWIIDNPEDEVTVTFDHGYNNIKTTKTITLGSAVPRPTDPTRTGYNFLGWYFANELYNFSSPVNYNITLIAEWEEKSNGDEYRVVTFDYGYDGITATQDVVLYSKVTRPEDPTREGYTFKGWYFVNDLYDFNTPVSYSFTLIAKWQAVADNVTVTFDYGYDNIKEFVTIHRGLRVARPTDPARAGYTFKGWYFANELYNFNNPVNYSITIIAEWQQNPPTTYTVMFNSNGGSSVPSQTVNSGGLASRPADPTREGYTFVRWNLGANAYNFSTPVNSNITLTAVWEEVTNPDDNVTVTFDYGYDNIQNTVTITRGTKVTRPTDPTREGYTFVRWNLGGVEYNFSNTVNDNIVLIAEWSKSKYTITFNSDGGSSVSNQEVEYGDKILKPFTPNKANYYFKGWYVGNEKYDFDQEVSGDVSLTAKWESLSNLQQVSIYGKTTIRLKLGSNEPGLVFEGMKNKNVEGEHGFYLVYGRTTLNALRTAIINNAKINDKEVIKVIVPAVLENGVYRVIVYGIPEANFGDVITAVPYVLVGGETIFAEEENMSSVNHAITLQASASVSVNVTLTELEEKKKLLNNI